LASRSGQKRLVGLRAKNNGEPKSLSEVHGPSANESRRRMTLERWTKLLGRAVGSQ